jgi:hypothetical protein
LLRETPIELFEEWRTLYGLEPWADERTDFAIGTAIANSNACHGVEPKPPRDYMHYLRREEQGKESPGDVAKKRARLTERINAKVSNG